MMTRTDGKKGGSESWVRRRGLMRAGVLVLWSAVIVLGLGLGLGLVLMGSGVGRTVYFEPTGEALAEARTGDLLILAGSVCLLLCAAWGRYMKVPLWACMLVAVPSVLVGGLTLLWGSSLFPELSYLVAIPVAATGVIGGLVLATPFRPATERIEKQ